MFIIVKTRVLVVSLSLMLPGNAIRSLDARVHKLIHLWNLFHYDGRVLCFRVSVTQINDNFAFLIPTTPPATPSPNEEPKKGERNQEAYH
jgi:hypothetical protein